MVQSLILALTTMTGAACPPVTIVRTPAEPERAVHIAFLPEGFTEAELPRYRCAVRTVTDRLLAEPPFSSWVSRIGVERMDLVSLDGRVETRADCEKTCPGECPDTGPCAYTDTNWGVACSGSNLSDPVPSDPVPERDFGVEVCGGGLGTRCEWLSVFDFDGITDLSTCFTAPTLVVVLAKRFGVAGGLGKEQQPPLAVVTVEGMQTEAAARLLAHELGHSLGLLDEYGVAGPVDSFDVNMSPECGRNVVVAEKCCGYGVPWVGRCVDVQNFDNGCDEEMTGCGDPPVFLWSLGECEMVRAASYGCPGRGNCKNSINPPPTTLAVVEGAFYRDCDAYRPALYCRMRYHADGFCPVCEAWLDASLEALTGGTRMEVLNLNRTYALTLVRPPGPDPPEAIWEISGGPFTDSFSTPSWSLLAEARLVEIDEVVETEGFRARVPLRRLELEFRDTGKGPARIVLVPGVPSVTLVGTPRAPEQGGPERRWWITTSGVRAYSGSGTEAHVPKAIRVRYIPAGTR